jgi:hypothetical protein
MKGWVGFRGPQDNELVICARGGGGGGWLVPRHPSTLRLVGEEPDLPEVGLFDCPDPDIFIVGDSRFRFVQGFDAGESGSMREGPWRPGLEMLHGELSLSGCAMRPQPQRISVTLESQCA